jgi:sulfate/thiosulfate transport system permease protein
LSSPIREPFGVRLFLLGIAVAFLGLVVVLPLIAVFSEAFDRGWSAYAAAISDAETLAAVKLTLQVALIAVPLNTIFGLACAWLLAKYEFRAKGILSALIDVPFSVSPVIAGLIFVLLFGSQGIFGEFLQAHDIKIIFAVPGIALTTMFVTVPFVAREVLPLLESQKSDQEEAALTLGASGMQMFLQVTLPRIKWALLAGVILCNARAMGEFGAVSVVSGHIRGVTTTLPLHVEILYNEYAFVGSFAAASLLTFLAFGTLIAKKLIEQQLARRS